MKDRYFEAYEAALQSLPEKQRSSLVNLIGAHGLRPDDPMIVGSVFTHMLLGRVDGVLSNFESATNPKRVAYTVSVLRALAATLEQSRALAAFLVILALLCCLAAGVGVHNADRLEEHSRICAAESRWLQTFETHVAYRYVQLTDALAGKVPAGCQ